MAWSTLMAMVADQPDESKRGRYMGLMGAAPDFRGVAGRADRRLPVAGGWGCGRRSRWPASCSWRSASAASSCATSRACAIQVGFAAILANLKQRPRLLLPYCFQFVDRYTVGLFVVLFPVYLSTHLGVGRPGGARPLPGDVPAALFVPAVLHRPLLGEGRALPAAVVGLGTLRGGALPGRLLRPARSVVGDVRAGSAGGGDVPAGDDADRAALGRADPRLGDGRVQPGGLAGLRAGAHLRALDLRNERLRGGLHGQWRARDPGGDRGPAGALALAS